MPGSESTHHSQRATERLVVNFSLICLAERQRSKVRPRGRISVRDWRSAGSAPCQTRSPAMASAVSHWRTRSSSSSTTAPGHRPNGVITISW